MTFKIATAAILAAVLVACGGGGGGGSAAPAAPATSATTAVQITSSNAPTVAAHAVDTVQNTTAVDSSASLAAGVQVQPGAAAGTPTIRVLADLVRTAAGNMPGPSMATGVTSTQTVACLNNQGTLTISGTVAGSTGLTAGDTITLQASNCTSSVDGVQQVLNGTLTFTVVSGSMPSAATPPFHIVVTFTATNLSVVAGTDRKSISGDITLDLNAVSSTNETITASGTSLANGETTASGFHTTTWSGYSQKVTLSGAAVSSALNGAITTDNTKLGAVGGSYTVSTTQDLQWNTSSTTPVAGVVKVVGAGGSGLQVTFSSTGATVQVDANGDGTYESSTTLTAAQLKALL